MAYLWRTLNSYWAINILSCTKKNFSGLIQSLDKYCMSSNQEIEITQLFGHQPNDTDMHLTYIYKHLLPKFLTYFTDYSGDLQRVMNITQISTHSSAASQVCDNSLVCVAKHLHNQQEKVLYNIRKTKEQNKVTDSHQKVKMLQTLTVSKQSIQPTSMHPQTLMLAGYIMSRVCLRWD